MKKVYEVAIDTGYERVVEGIFTTKEEAMKCVDAIEKYLEYDIDLVEINVLDKFDLEQFKINYDIIIIESE